MSYFENLTPAHALEAIGLRRDEIRIMDVLVPTLVAFGIGIGVGAGAALLFTPQTGRQLRGEIKASAGRIQETVRKNVPTALRADHDDAYDDGIHVK